VVNKRTTYYYCFMAPCINALTYLLTKHASLRFTDTNLWVKFFTRLHHTLGVVVHRQILQSAANLRATYRTLGCPSVLLAQMHYTPETERVRTRQILRTAEPFQTYWTFGNATERHFPPVGLHQAGEWQWQRKRVKTMHGYSRYL